MSYRIRIALGGVDELPHWEPLTPAVLCVAGPHPIPVSTAIRAANDRIVLALGSGRETLERLRADPGVALCVLGGGVAFTAHGQASVLGQLEAVATAVAIEIAVDRVQDHLADGRTEMLGGAPWRWLDEQAAAAEPAILAELARL